MKPCYEAIKALAGVKYLAKALVCIPEDIDSEVGEIILKCIDELVEYAQDRL